MIEKIKMSIAWSVVWTPALFTTLFFSYLTLNSCGNKELTEPTVKPVQTEQLPLGATTIKQQELLAKLEEKIQSRENQMKDIESRLEKLDEESNKILKHIRKNAKLVEQIKEIEERFIEVQAKIGQHEKILDSYYGLIATNQHLANEAKAKVGEISKKVEKNRGLVRKELDLLQKHGDKKFLWFHKHDGKLVEGVKEIKQTLSK